MSTVELKNAISKYLMLIEDISFLNAIKIIIESKVKATEDLYILSEFQKQRIDKGCEQLKQGQKFHKIIYKKEIDQWLSTK